MEMRGCVSNVFQAYDARQAYDNRSEYDTIVTSFNPCPGVAYSPYKNVYLRSSRMTIVRTIFILAAIRGPWLTSSVAGKYIPCQRFKITVCSVEKMQVVLHMYGLIEHCKWCTMCTHFRKEPAQSAPSIRQKCKV